MRKSVGLLCAGLLASIAFGAQANLLTNPGFETGDLSGWTVSGSVPLGYGVGTSGQATPDGALGSGSVLVHGGSFAAWAVTRNFFGDGLQLSQTLQLNAGEYSAGFFYGSNRGPYANALAIYLDGAALTSGGPYIDNGFLEQKTTFQLASSGSHTLSFLLSGSGFGPAPISADDFYLKGTAPVPEPASAALLCAGLLGVWAMRRRRA